MRSLAIDLFCGLGGWTEGLLAEGYDVIGFDIERHEYGDHRYPARLVLQDVRTLHGAQFKDAALIVASPPCQKYSYMAMPWRRAKELARWYRDDPGRQVELNELFRACFRIQSEACAASGRHIPLIVENVRGAEPWVGRARWSFGSFYLWGDVPALMPITTRPRKVSGFRFDGSGRSFQSAAVVESGFKSQGLNWSDRTKRGQDFTRIAGLQNGYKGIPHRTAGHWTNPAEDGIKCGGDWFSAGTDCSEQRRHGSRSNGRQFASAMIAKIPLVLSRHIAAVYKTETAQSHARERAV